MPEPHHALVITCEHGGNQVPPEFSDLFASHLDVLATHRGHDPGALEMARHLAEQLEAPLYKAEVTRLLVDLNRSPGHPGLFSEITRPLPPASREDILARYYRPHRTIVEDHIGTLIAQGKPVLHIAAHSFTPVLEGKARNADIGLLYDPTRLPEKEFCIAWQIALQNALPHMQVRRNFPYRGASDGLTAYLRKYHAAKAYLGIELEINQKHVGKADWNALCRRVSETLKCLTDTAS